MFVKSLIAVAAVASAVSFASAPAKAETTVDIGIGIGLGGFYPGDGYGYVDDGYPGDYPRYPRPRRHFDDYAPVMSYGVSCNRGRSIVRSEGFRNVRAYDCSAPTYGYKAWRDGELYQVKVSYRGRIISVRPIY
jgi:hypothetical protein